MTLRTFALLPPQHAERWGREDQHEPAVAAVQEVHELGASVLLSKSSSVVRQELGASAPVVRQELGASVPVVRQELGASDQEAQMGGDQVELLASSEACLQVAPVKLA